MHHFCFTLIFLTSLSFKVSLLSFLHYGDLFTHIYTHTHPIPLFSLCSLLPAFLLCYPSSLCHCSSSSHLECTLERSHILASLIYGTWQIKYLQARKIAVMKGNEKPRAGRLPLCLFPALNYARCCPDWRKMEVWNIKSFIWSTLMHLLLHFKALCRCTALTCKSIALRFKMCHDLSVSSYKRVFGHQPGCLLLFTQQLNMHDWDFEIWFILS